MEFTLGIRIKNETPMVIGLAMSANVSFILKLHYVEEKGSCP